MELLRLILNTICMAHSVMVMTNGVKPSENMLIMRLGCKRISLNENLNMLFLLKKNAIIHRNDIDCETTVARLAPLTPIFNTNIKSGSRAMFIIAPISIENIAIIDAPCAVINGLSPCANNTNSVPKE